MLTAAWPPQLVLLSSSQGKIADEKEPKVLNFDNLVKVMDLSLAHIQLNMNFNRLADP